MGEAVTVAGFENPAKEPGLTQSLRGGDGGCCRWDFPMLAMSAARNGETEKAIEWLLHPLFEFDEVGMPVGGVRVPTPYFPGAGALLYAVAMMAEGWDGSQGDAPGFPAQGWKVLAEGLSMAL